MKMKAREPPVGAVIFRKKIRKSHPSLLQLYQQAGIIKLEREGDAYDTKGNDRSAGNDDVLIRQESRTSRKCSNVYGKSSSRSLQMSVRTYLPCSKDLERIHGITRGAGFPDPGAESIGKGPERSRTARRKAGIIEKGSV